MAAFNQSVDFVAENVMFGCGVLIIISSTDYLPCQLLWVGCVSGWNSVSDAYCVICDD